MPRCSKDTHFYFYFFIFFNFSIIKFSQCYVYDLDLKTRPGLKTWTVRIKSKINKPDETVYVVDYLLTYLGYHVDLTHCPKLTNLVFTPILDFEWFRKKPVSSSSLLGVLEVNLG